VISAAADIVESRGYSGLTMSALAAVLGVKPPSLYNHINGIDDVWQSLATIALRRIEKAILNAAVGRSKESAIREMAYAYRRFATGHAELYRAFTNVPAIDGMESELGSLAATLRRVLRPFELRADDETNFIRNFHSCLHGFAALESAGFFRNGNGVDANSSFHELVENQLLILRHYRGIPQ
jgi:AcrR family transcriptional regulator